MTVEELQAKLCENLTFEFNGMLRGVLNDFPSLFAAIEARGVEKGTEQLRRKILKVAEQTEFTVSETITKSDGRRQWQETISRREAGYVIPASVLDPEEAKT